MSRFDPWKDPIGVIKGFEVLHEQLPETQLVLIGSSADDDPEGTRYWELTQEAGVGGDHIHLLRDVDDVVVNRFQRLARVVVQKSLREGFGLTVSEALWKGRPVVAGRAGGISCRYGTALTATSWTLPSSSRRVRSTCSSTPHERTIWGPLVESRYGPIFC